MTLILNETDIKKALVAYLMSNGLITSCERISLQPPAIRASTIIVDNTKSEEVGVKGTFLQEGSEGQ